MKIILNQKKSNLKYHREIRVVYNGVYIGKVGNDNESIIYSTRELVENIIKDYASKLALSYLKELQSG